MLDANFDGLGIPVAPEDDLDQRWAEIANGPAISAQHVRNSSAVAPRFVDPSWRLDALGVGAGGKKTTLYFNPSPNDRKDIVHPPAIYADTLKRFAYLAINEPVPLAYRSQAWSSAVERMSPGTIRNVTQGVRHLMQWLAEHGVTCLGDCTQDVLDAYYHDVVKRTDIDGGRKFHLLSSVERLPFLAESLPASDRLCLPRWKASDARGRGGKAAGSNREVLDPEIADPLLSFVILCVRVLAPDIFAAHDRAVALADAPVEGYQFTRAKRVLHDLARTGGIPAERLRTGRLRLDASGLQSVHRIDSTVFSLALRREALQDRLTDERAVVVDSPVRGLVNDQPWCQGVPWKAVEGSFPVLLRHLQAACWVLMAFLSGARPDEVRRLPIDPLTVVPPRRAGGAVRYYLTGTKRKGVRDSEGRASLEGQPERWVTVGPAVDAIRVAAEVARRVHSDPTYLFPGTNGADAIGHSTMAQRVAQMIDWADSLMTANDWPEAHRIVHNKGDYWDLAGFRRTTAWHIRRQRGGEAALALQFKHLSTSLGDGYASVADVGVRRVMDRAEREAHDEVMAELTNVLINGTHVSGPAAQRLIEAVRVEHPLEATFVTEREARRITDGGARVFDNPSAYSLCVFEPRFAKCLTPSDDPSDTDRHAPDRGSCKASCACHARTDAEIERLRVEVAQHRREASNPLLPEPLAVRLQQVAERKTAQISDHERTAVFISLDTLTVREDVLP